MALIAGGTPARATAGSVGDPVGDVQVEEVGPALEVGQGQAVAVGAVGQVGVQLVGAGEAVEHVGEVAAGLLVLPLAGEEDGDVDPVDELGGTDRAEPVGVVIGLGLEAGHQVEVLGAQGLVAVAVRVALVDLLVDVVGPVGGGVVADVAGPLGREPAVEDAAGVADAGVGIVDDRHRADGREVGGLGRRHEELGDAGIGDADHPDLVAGDPVLGGDGLDGVVAVGHLWALEEREGPARAAGAPQVHADGGVAEGIGQLQLGGRAGGVGGGVARHVDHRGVGPVGRDVVSREGREADHGGEGGAVPHLQVVDAFDQLLVLEERAGWCLVPGQHRDRLTGLDLVTGAGHHPVALAARDPAEGEQALVVDGARRRLGAERGEPGVDHLPIGVDQPQIGPRCRVLDHDRLDARPER